MTITHNNTIVAVATSKLPAGVGIIRLSGSKSIESVVKLAPEFKNAKNKMAYYCELTHNNELLDKAVLIKFNAPYSFTGEDVIEIQCHGSRAVLDKIMNTLLSFDGIVPAGHGEFSRRAFLNAKMDLTEAEGLCDLIMAETDQQRVQALRQLDGALGNKFEHWREEVMHLLAHVEASVDFPDEEIEIMEEAGLKQKIEVLIEEFTKAIDQKAGQRLREGFSIAIIGKPNAGKSTLTNLLTGKQTAIVSEIPGTTRDVVQAHLDIAGYPVVLQDTAGIRKTEDIIEAEGVRRSYKSAEMADIIILVTETSEINNMEEDLLNQLQAGKSLILSSKIDLNSEINIPRDLQYNDNKYKIINVNLTDDKSLDKIFPEIELMLKDLFKDVEDSAFLTRKRHTNSVTEAKKCLENALKLYNMGSAMSLSDLLAQDLRECSQKIGEITGRTDVEDLLDTVFSTFCIGK